jgi:hypothetical protein
LGDNGSRLGPVPPEAVHASVAERMRLYRRRRRRGYHYFMVLIGPAEVEGLVAKGHLPPDKRNDPEAISSALDDLMYACLVQTSP